MNYKLIFGALFLVAYPPSFYYVMERRKPEVIPQDLSIDRSKPRLSCGEGGPDVPLSMPCPASFQSTIGQVSGRYLVNSSTSEPLSIYSDKAGKNPSIIFDEKGVAHFPRGLNVDDVFYDGEKVESLGCKVTRFETSRKSTVQCGTSSSDVLDGPSCGDDRACLDKVKSEVASFSDIKLVVFEGDKQAENSRVGWTLKCPDAYKPLGGSCFATYGNYSVSDINEKDGAFLCVWNQIQPANRVVPIRMVVSCGKTSGTIQSRD